MDIIFTAALAALTPIALAVRITTQPMDVHDDTPNTRRIVFPVHRQHIDTASPASEQVHPWKRPLDLFVIAITFPIWLTAMAIVSAWIKSVSPGPVFYRQERIGRGGKPFMMYKFRSMKVNAETSAHVSHVTRLIQSNAPMTKLDHVGDDRLIPLGWAIRAVGLDELPQVFNVMRGEMSLVGPRPCTPYEFAHYQSSHVARVEVAPGLTGYWQVNGKNRTTFSEMIEMDIFYARNLSLRLDLKLLARTAPALLDDLLERLSRA